MPSWKKSLLARACIAPMLLLPALSPAQPGQAPPKASQLEAKGRILFEAERVEVPKFPDVPSTSPEADELARRLGGLARDLQIAWLKRGIDDQPLPSNLADRLSSAGTLHRKRIVAEVGRIATLTLTESPMPVKEDGRKKPATTPRTRGPHAVNGAGGPAEPIGRDQLEDFVEPHRSPKFNFIEQHSCKNPCILTLAQVALTLRLNDAAGSCLGYWGKKHLAAAEVARGLPDHARRLRQSLAEVAEIILLRDILDPGQVQKFKRAYWSSMGVHGLLEPEVAASLGISRDQRDMIAAALDEKTKQAIRMKEIRISSTGRFTSEEREQFSERWNEMYLNRLAEADEVVWGLLTPSQVSRYSKMVDEKASRPERVRRKEDASQRPTPAS